MGSSHPCGLCKESPKLLILARPRRVCCRQWRVKQQVENSVSVSLPFCHCVFQKDKQIVKNKNKTKKHKSFRSILFSCMGMQDHSFFGHWYFPAVFVFIQPAQTSLGVQQRGRATAFDNRHCVPSKLMSAFFPGAGECVWFGLFWLVLLSSSHGDVTSSSTGVGSG